MKIELNTYKRKVDSALSTSKNKSFAIATITIAFVLLMAFAGIIPSLSSLGVQIEANGKRDDLISKLERKLTTLKNLTREYNQKSTVVNYFNQVFPGELFQEQLITAMDELCTKNNLQLDNITFLNTEFDQATLQEITSKQVALSRFSITGQGSREDVLKLLGDLDNKRRIMNVKNLIVTRKTGSELVSDPTFKEYRFSMQVEIYYTNETIDNTKVN